MKFVKRLLLLAALAGATSHADDFWEQFTPEERQAAGYGQLTPEQRTLIERMAMRFAEARTKPAVAMAQEKAREAGRAEAEAANLAKKKANIGLAPREDDETEVVRTRIRGEFRGWTGHTTFRLSNDQVWQQDQPEDRFFPLMLDPEVEIRPSRLGGWKLTLLKHGLWIRVKRIH